MDSELEHLRQQARRAIRHHARPPSHDAVEELDHLARRDGARIAPPPFRYHVARENPLGVLGPSAVGFHVLFEKLVSQELHAVLVGASRGLGKRSRAARTARGPGIDATIQQVPVCLGFRTRQRQAHPGVRSEREPVRLARKLVAEQPDLRARGIDPQDQPAALRIADVPLLGPWA